MIPSSAASIIFEQLPAKTYLDPDLIPGATNTIGETLVYASSNNTVATIVNGRIHIVGAGTAVITAAFAPASNYSTSPPQSQLLVVNKAPQTIDFMNIPDLVKGSARDLPSPVASSGLPVMLVSADPKIASLSGLVLTGNSLGYTSVAAYQRGNENYLPAATVTRSFEVLNDANKLAIEVHQGVSPNGDGVNDVFTIEGIEKYPENRVTLYNRNGIKVYDTSGYNNSSNVFDGRSNINGRQLQAGTYFYNIQFMVNGKGQKATGYFVLKYQ